jgi:hypothetical protein
MFKRIIQDCHNHKGVIFGGAVRDVYLREYNERLYFEKYGDRRIDTVEFKDRLIVPKDIDCALLAVDYDKLMKTLQKKYYIQYQFEADANYLLDIPNENYHFYRYTLLELHESPVVIQLDLIVQLNGVKVITPFVHFDFDVNSLLWSKHSIRVNPNAIPILAPLYGIYNNTCMQDSMVYSILLDHIVSKNATICTPVKKRINKMKRYGWKIHHKYETIQIQNVPYDGVCVLCQDKIDGDHSTFLCKCAHICMPCLVSHYNVLTKCTICTKIIDPYKLKNDVQMYSTIHLTPQSGMSIRVQDFIFTFLHLESVD